MLQSLLIAPLEDLSFLLSNVKGIGDVVAVGAIYIV
jgi:hypothetical protein